MRHLLTIAFACFAASAAAQEPLYIVNGEVRCEVRSIPPDDIEHIEVFPAEEATIARFGTEAANGAIVLTLRYDRPPHAPRTLRRDPVEGLYFFITSRVVR